LFDFLARDQLHIFIHPEYLLLMRINSKQEVVKKQVLQLESTPEIQREMNGWQPALSHLQGRIAQAEWKNIGTHIVISNHFVRYASIPWNAELSNRAEQLAYLKHSFVKRYGDAAKLWDLRMTTPDFQQTTLASGISDLFLLQLQACCSDAGLKMLTIQPHLMFALNQSRAELSERSVCFVMVEHGRICVAMIHHGILQSVTDYATELNIARQVEAVIKRESIMLGLDAEDWPIVYWSDLTGQNTRFTHKEIKTIAHPYWQEGTNNLEHLNVLNRQGI
jgi:hypothetical protein